MAKPRNVFILSPGRTGTHALSAAFAVLPNFTTGHESRVELLGGDRIAYPENHVEADNRLIWFLPRLTASFADRGLLVVVRRDPVAIAYSYMHRWYKTNIMKAYSQGILLRDTPESSVDVAIDYVETCYETIDWFLPQWDSAINLDIEDPEQGVEAICVAIGMEDYASQVLARLHGPPTNQNQLTYRDRASIIRHASRNLLWDLRQALQ